MQVDLTEGNLFHKIVRFSVPYLIASFLQTFYGLADLFITGQFNGSGPITAVAVGSQVMHMLTVIIIGLAMGTTVTVARSVGAKDREKAGRYIGNSITIFAVFAAAATALLIFCTDGILSALSTPAEAWTQAHQYLLICFAGVPFITAYNVISSIFRGLGDTKSPMIFVAIAGVINIGLDYLLVGPMAMGAAGAAIATVSAQAISVVIAFLTFINKNRDIRVNGKLLRPDGLICRELLGIGAPIALQDGVIQISFLIITRIANGRGVDVASAVGIVEKFISFVFLVPSAMLSTVSAAAAQNAGAGRHDRGRQALRFGILTCIGFGIIIFVICQFAADGIVGLFAPGEPRVAVLGGQYLRAYSFDVALAGIHFCFSGFFSAYGKSVYSFLHNIISVAAMRVPGAWLASVLWPATLYPMGLAAPLGSLLSALICMYLYRKNKRSMIDAQTAVQR